MTDRDLALLGWIAGRRMVLAGQVRVWLGVSELVAYRRLAVLCRAGLLSYERIFHAQPGCYRVTNGGLAICDSGLPLPRVDLRSYRHDLGVIWLELALAQEAGIVGVVSEREMRSHDLRADTHRERFGVPLGGVGGGGRPRWHYPDLLLQTGHGLVAVELELTGKGRRRLDRILAAYARDRRLCAVRYFTDRPQLATLIEHAARRVGAEGLIGVETFTWQDPARPPRGGAAGMVETTNRETTR